MNSSNPRINAEGALHYVRSKLIAVCNMTKLQENEQQEQDK
jgi:hypothetical protein